MATTQRSISQQSEQVNYKRIWWVGLGAAVAAAVVNGIIYLIANAAGAMPESARVPGIDQAITLAPVIFSTFAFIMIGTAVLAIIGRLARRPISLFRIVAIVALVLSLGQPFLITGAPASMLISLIIMHIVAGVTAIGALTTQAAQR